MINIPEHYEPQRKAKEFSDFIVGLFSLLVIAVQLQTSKNEVG